ncbi:MAG: four helix bundle protein [Bacteroidales bacterium]|nr:four helix bundle protein [Bacteroidales bacterium]
MYVYSFERLEVWLLTREFFKYSYSLINKFPQYEKYNLVDQIRRATTSISLNLAEIQIRIKEISNKINALKNSQYKRMEQNNNSTNKTTKQQINK